MTALKHLQLGLLAAIAAAGMHPATCAFGATIVRFETVEGNFDIQLFDTAMPRTVTNFLAYVNADRYDGSVVHRNSDTDPNAPPVRDFVIQGGGYKLNDPTGMQTTITYTDVPEFAPILDEPGGGVFGPSNVVGTIAMAKSGPNTVNSEWFINQGNNSVLDNPARPDGGFAAFGKVLGNGMTVVNKIGDLKIPSELGFSISPPFNDLPLRDNFSGNKISDIRVVNTVTVTSVRVLNLSPGDFDRNGVVNNADLAILNANFGITAGALFDQGDSNMDGKVGGFDFLAWQRARGASGTPVGAVPEPAGALLTFLASGALAISRRRRVAASR